MTVDFKRLKPNRVFRRDTVYFGQDTAGYVPCLQPRHPLNNQRPARPRNH